MTDPAGVAPTPPERAVPRRAWLVLAALGAGTLGLVLAYGPRSCEGGLEVYLLGGLAAVVAAFAVPVVAARLALWKRLAAGAGFAVTILAVWVAGWNLGGFRLLCRLF